MRYRFVFRVWLTIGLLLSCFSTQATPNGAHYIVVRESASGVLTILSHQMVNVTGVKHGVDAHTEDTALLRSLSATIQQKDSNLILHSSMIKASPWVRAEFHGEHEIDGRTFLAGTVEYVVRVPHKKGAVLRLEVEKTTAPTSAAVEKNQLLAPMFDSVLTVDLDELADNASTEKSQSSIAQSVPTNSVSTGVISRRTGDPANRLDFLIVAEGYTEAQKELFIADATRHANGIFSISPYKDFQHLVNFHWLFVASNQAGADKPACKETPGSAVFAVDTAFDASFCTKGTRRLLTVNNAKVFAAAAAVPEWDVVLVLVNDAEYGGAGGNVGVVSHHDKTVELAQHELGHTLGLLADEYVDSAVANGRQQCSDRESSSFPRCPANVTDEKERTKIKWRSWIADSTPIPTIGPATDLRAAGLWEGGNYLPTGAYRQCLDGIMRTLTKPFCYVDSEAIVKRVFQGADGGSGVGLSSIETDTTPATSAVEGTTGTTILFSAKLAGTLIPDNLEASWWVDGTQLVNKTTNATHGDVVTLEYLIADSGAHTIELRVTHHTPLSKTAFVSTKRWAINGPRDYSDMWWAGSSENGWGVSITQHGAIPFVVFFIYDSTGRPTFYAMPGAQLSDDGRTFTGALYQPTSSPYSAYDPSRFSANASIGSATFTFTDINTASVEYTINGIRGVKTIQRQIFGRKEDIPKLRVNDLWWGGTAQNGWGLNIAQQGNTVFPIWYTYDLTGRATWFAVPGGTWSGNQFVGDLYSVTSAPWLGVPYDPTRFLPTKVGTMTLTFTDQSNAVMTYEIGGITQFKTITRQLF